MLARSVGHSPAVGKWCFMTTLKHIFRAAFTLSSLTGATALYSFAILSLGLSAFTLTEYGQLAQIIAVYGFLSRVVTWGFEFQLRDVLDSVDLTMPELVLAKLILFIPAVVLYFLLNALIWEADYFAVVALGLLSFCFNTQVYYQAIGSQKEIFASVVFGLTLGTAFMAICFFAAAITPSTYLAAIFIAPNVGWVINLLESIRKNGRPVAFTRSWQAVRYCTKMFAVKLIPGSYVNLIPILMGVGGELESAAYHLLCRASNLAKNFGIMVRQVSFYERASESFANTLWLGLLGSLFSTFVVVGTLFSFFRQQVTELFSGVSYFSFMVAAYVCVGVVANHYIVSAFFENKRYLQYAATAGLIVVVCLLLVHFTNMPLAAYLWAHLLIEACIILAAFMVRKFSLNF